MQRPTRIPVFGILCLILSGLILLQNLSQLVAVVKGPDGIDVPSANEFPGQVGKSVRDSLVAQQDAMRKPVYRVGLGLKSVLNLLMAGALIAAGIGLRRDKLWAIRMAKTWALFAIFSALAATLLQAVYIVSAISEASSTPGMAGAMYIGLTFMLVLLCIFPFLLLWVLPSANVMTYLKAQESGKPQQPSATSINSATPPPTTPPPTDSTSISQTWRDDPWNDPNSR